MEFRQTPGGRGLILLGFFLLKIHENGIFGSCVAEMALHSSPREMGLHVEVGTVLRQSMA